MGTPRLLRAGEAQGGWLLGCLFSLWGNVPFLLSFLFLQPRAHALAFPPALPYRPGPGTGAAGDSPMAPSPHQHGEVGLAEALRDAQCWEIIPANPDHDGSALQHPSGCAGIAFWCQQGSHQHHLLVLSESPWSLCRPTVPFSPFPMAQHTPPGWPWVYPTAPRVGSSLILLLDGG